MKFVLFFMLVSLGIVLNSCEQSPANKGKSSNTNHENDSIVVNDLLKQALDSAQTNYSFSIERAFEANVLAESSGNPNLRIRSSMQLGKLYFYKGLYEEATDCYISMKEIAEEINSIYWQALASTQLGGVRLVLEDYEAAKGYFETGESLLIEYFESEPLIPTNTRMALCNNFGVIYLGLNEFEKAETELKKGMAHYTGSSLEEHYSFVQLLNNMGDVYVKINLFEESLRNYNEALQVLSSHPHALLESMIFNSLGKIHFQIQEYDEALTYFQRGFKMAKQVNGFSHLSHLAKGISETYQALNMADSALFYVQLKQNYKDSLQLDRAAQRIFAHEMMVSFENERKIKSQQESRIRLIAVLTVIILGTTMLIFFVKNKWRKRKIAFLEEEKLEYKKLAKESKFENESLKKNIEQKEKDLSDISMHVILKNRLIDNLKNKIESESNNHEEREVTIAELSKILDNENQDTQLNDFEFYFGKIHPDFFAKLQNQYSNLTRNERRLSALLKLQLTTKEISSITGQSIRAIEIARTRLRKKLDLKDSSINLYDFFVSF